MRPHNGTLTSKAAARKADVVRGVDIVRSVLYAVGNLGATREQIAIASGLPLDTVNARLNELGHAGEVFALKTTRKLSTGRQGLAFILSMYAGGLSLADWPKPREDWKRRALAAEARLREVGL